MEQWVQVSEEGFNYLVNKHGLTCTDDLGAGRYACYYTHDDKVMARIDQSLGKYELLIEEQIK